MLYKGLSIERAKARPGVALAKELFVGVGDFVHLRSPEKGLPYIARVTDFWEDPRTSFKMMTVQWCYRGSDLPQDCGDSNQEMIDENEIFFTTFFDDNEVGTILSTVRISFVSGKPSSKTRRWFSSLLMDDVDETYGWGDELLNDGPTSSEKQCNYLCSRKYSLKRNRLVPLTEEDIHGLTSSVSGMTKMAVRTLTAEIIQLRATKLASRVNPLGNMVTPQGAAKRHPSSAANSEMNPTNENFALAVSPPSSSTQNRVRGIQDECSTNCNFKQLRLTVDELGEHAEDSDDQSVSTNQAVAYEDTAVWQDQSHKAAALEEEAPGLDWKKPDRGYCVIQ
jgi:hypothetical protein